MPDVPSPRATRQSRPKWLDPKLFLGILLVLVSMAIGARIIGDATVTTAVYVASQDIALGEVIDQDEMLEVNNDVRFSSDDDANLYIGGTAELPEGTRTLRSISAGELLPRAAITNAEDEQLRTFSVPVAGEHMPNHLEPGDFIDLWFKPQDEGGSDPVLALQNALLVTVPEGNDLGGGGAITIQVKLDTATDGDGNPFSPFDFLVRVATMDAYPFEVGFPTGLTSSD